jgi:hypothetical protein
VLGLVERDVSSDPARRVRADRDDSSVRRVRPDRDDSSVCRFVDSSSAAARGRAPMAERIADWAIWRTA